jgi:tetratricopeptide (TPR) repeat protein
MKARLLWLLSACLLSSVLACSNAKTGAEARADLNTFKREQNPERLYDYGRAYAQVGDLTRAEQYLAASIAAGGDSRKILPLLIRVCIQDGRYRVAIRYAEEYLHDHPGDYRSRFVLGTLYSAVGDGDDARKNFEQVLERSPEDADAHFALAVLMRDTFEDPVGADHHFREYLRLKPGGSHREEAESSLLKSVQ